MKQDTSILLIAILALGAALNATPKQDPGAFFFPTQAPTQGLNLEYGKKAMEERLYKNAQRYFQIYLDQEAQTAENKAEATALLARAYLKDGQPLEALKTVNDYLSIPANQSPSAFSNSLYLTGGQACIQQKDYEAALNFLNPLREVPKEELGVFRPELIDAITAAWNATGRWEESESLLDDEIKNVGLADEDLHKLTWRRLETAIAQEKWQKAKEFIAQLKETALVPEDKTRLDLMQILCYIGEGNLDSALNEYKAQNLAPKVPREPSPQWWEALSKLADACQQQGNNKEAADLCGKARGVATTNEQNNEMAKKQVEALVKIGELQKAKEILSELHTALSLDFAVTMRLGEIQRELGDSNSATQSFLEVFNGGEKVAKELRFKAALEVAHCYANEHRYTEAQNFYHQAASLTDSPNFKAEALRLEAQQLENAGKIDDAIKSFQATADQFGDAIPEAAAARVEAARLLAVQGKNVEACEQYEIFLKNHDQEDDLYWQAKIGVGKATIEPQEGSECLLEVALNCSDDAMRRGALEDSFNRAMELQGETALAQAQKILNDYNGALNQFPEKKQDLCELNYQLVLRALEIEGQNCFEIGEHFLETYPDAVKTPEIALRLGDAYANLAYANIGESQATGENGASSDNPVHNAIEKYREAAKFPNVNSDIRRLALYEEARLTYTLDLTSEINTIAEKEKGTQETVEATVSGQARALGLLDTLITETPVTDIIVIRALFLKGDILTKQNKTDEALVAYDTAQKAAETQAPPLSLALRGRMAELYYSKGEYDKALGIAKPIVDDENLNDPALKGRAMLICARCEREKEETQLAVEYYNKIRDNYESTLRETPQDAVVPNVYVNAVRELLEIYGSTDNANMVRKSYNDLRTKGHNLPPLPDSVKSKN